LFQDPNIRWRKTEEVKQKRKLPPTPRTAHKAVSTKSQVKLSRAAKKNTQTGSERDKGAGKTTCRRLQRQHANSNAAHAATHHVGGTQQRASGSYVNKHESSNGMRVEVADGGSTMRPYSYSTAAHLLTASHAAEATISAQAASGRRKGRETAKEHAYAPTADHPFSQARHGNGGYMCISSPESSSAHARLIVSGTFGVGKFGDEPYGVDPSGVEIVSGSIEIASGGDTTVSGGDETISSVTEITSGGNATVSGDGAGEGSTGGGGGIDGCGGAGVVVDSTHGGRNKLGISPIGVAPFGVVPISVVSISVTPFDSGDGSESSRCGGDEPGDRSKPSPCNGGESGGTCVHCGGERMHSDSGVPTLGS